MKPKSVYLFTNRNCLVFDENGEQISRYQAGISCYKLNKKLAQEVADQAEEFFIARYGQWTHDLSKKEFEYLLGLRTRERDIRDMEDEK